MFRAFFSISKILRVLKNDLHCIQEWQFSNLSMHVAIIKLFFIRKLLTFLRQLLFLTHSLFYFIANFSIFHLIFVFQYSEYFSFRPLLFLFISTFEKICACYLYMLFSVFLFSYCFTYTTINFPHFFSYTFVHLLGNVNGHHSTLMIISGFFS